MTDALNRYWEEMIEDDNVSIDKGKGIADDQRRSMENSLIEQECEICRCLTRRWRRKNAPGGKGLYTLGYRSNTQLPHFCNILPYFHASDFSKEAPIPRRELFKEVAKVHPGK